MQTVTNNPQVAEKFPHVVFVEGSYGDVLLKVKKMVIDEHFLLLSHPLSGSIKPDETYYKTIFVANTRSRSIDMESLEYMESAIQVYEKFINNRRNPRWSEQILADFAFVDFSIARSTLQRMGVNL